MYNNFSNKVIVMLLISLQKSQATKLVALNKLIYQIHHLFSVCASALPHLSCNSLGNDTNRKEKKNPQMFKQCC